MYFYWAFFECIKDEEKKKDLSGSLLAFALKSICMQFFL